MGDGGGGRERGDVRKREVKNGEYLHMEEGRTQLRKHYSYSKFEIENGCGRRERERCVKGEIKAKHGGK